MARLKVKKNKAIKALLDEVSGKKQYPKTFFRGKSGKPGQLKPKKPQQMTPAQKIAFRSLCDKKYKLEQEIHDLQVAYEGGTTSKGIAVVGMIPTIKSRITKSTELHGRQVNDQDSVLYVHPHKVQVEMIAGAIEDEQVLEWARKNMPDLIGQEKSKTLDLLKLEETIKTDRMLSKFFREALAVVLKYSEDKKLIKEKASSEYLDLARYEEAKADGQIPQKLIEAVESEHSPRLQMWRLTDAKPRCPGCGVGTSRANKPDFSCDNCGFGLKMVKHS